MPKGYVLMQNDNPIACQVGLFAEEAMILAREDFAKDNNYTHQRGTLYINLRGTHIYLHINQVRVPDEEA